MPKRLKTAISGRKTKRPGKQSPVFLYQQQFSINEIAFTLAACFCESNHDNRPTDRRMAEKEVPLSRRRNRYIANCLETYVSENPFLAACFCANSHGSEPVDRRTAEMEVPLSLRRNRRIANYPETSAFENHHLV